MTKTEYNKQLELYKWGIIEKKDKVTGKFTFTYNKTEYNLFGTYSYKYDVMKWDLYKEKIDDRENTLVCIDFPEYNEKTPKRALVLMDKVEWYVKREFAQHTNDNMWNE